MTAEILFYKQQNSNINIQWINWAIEMLQAGYETENLIILAGEDIHCNLSVFGGNNTETETMLKEQRAYVEPLSPNIAADPVVQYMTKAQMQKSIERTRKLMQEAAKKLEFIEAAQYRDELLKLEDLMKEKWG